MDKQLIFQNHSMNISILKNLKNIQRVRHLAFFGSIVLALLLGLTTTQILSLNKQTRELSQKEAGIRKNLDAVKKELQTIKNEDQYVKNKKLEDDIKNIETTYKKAVVSYEKLLDLKSVSNKTDSLDKAFAQILTLLSQRNYASAGATLTSLNKQLDDEQTKIASTFSIPKNVPSSNTPPTSGYSRQQVSTDIGTFLVDVVSADMNATRVIVDTASDSTCKDNCPVLPLADYVARSGAFAGVNGSYFCPAAYPTCAGKTNSFDTLLMNKNKAYFNSENNVYSTVPAVIFLGSSMRFVGQSLEWGRDTGVDGVIANQPLLLSGGNIAFGGGSDPKQGSKGSRSFVGAKGNVAYIGVVHNATVAEVAHVLKTLGLEGALNLDSGGSTALWHAGYKVGPGRNIPNAVLFIRK